MKEITYEELKVLPEDSYVLIDIRDEGLITYGMIPGAVHIFIDDLENSGKLAEIPREKKLILYCEVGRRSREIDDTAECFEGRDCYSLSEGYVGFVRAGIQNGDDKEEKRKCAEASIQKKYHKQLFSPFAKACKIYQLIDDGGVFSDLPSHAHGVMHDDDGEHAGHGKLEGPQSEIVGGGGGHGYYCGRMAAWHSAISK